MNEVKIVLKGISPIEFGRAFQTPKEDKESHDAHEQRCWRERMHVDDYGYVIHNALAIKNALQEVARYKSETIKGKGKSTYTKKFERGVMPTGPIVITDGDGNRIKAADVAGDTRSVPSDGKAGGGTRVNRTFPIIHDWKAEATLMVIDHLLTEDLDRVRLYLEDAGQFIGIGSFRPEKRGYFGRFTVERFDVS